MPVRADPVRLRLPAARARAGRPTSERAAEIDGLVRAAARRLFLEPGFDATTMDEVAAAAGVSKGTLYARYASKDALLQAVIDDVLAQLHTRSSASDDQLPVALGPRLEAYAHKLVETFGWTEYVQLNRLMQAAAKDYPALVRHWHDAITKGYTDLIAREMRKAAGPAARPGTDWDALANLFTFAISGWHANAVATRTLTPARFDAYCAIVAQTVVIAAIEPGGAV